MKRILSCIFLVFLLVFGGCQKEDIIEETVTESLEVSTELFLYEEVKEVDVITVDENGYLYTATCITNIEEATLKEDFIQQFKVYDLEGNCVKEIEIALGTGTISLLNAENGMLYCIVMKSELAVWGPTLYTIDTTTWEVNEVYLFETYSYLSNFAHVGDYFYVIGTLKEIPEKEYELHPNIDSYTYNGECVSRIKVGENNPKEEILPIDFPIDIVRTKKDTLTIYHYNEEKGFGFLEFDPKKAILQEVGWSERNEFFSGLIQCRDGFLMSKFGKIFYGTVNNIEAQISEKDSTKLDYQKGFLFYLTKEGVERIGIDDLIRGNTPIRMLLYNTYMQEPYDNGYLVEKTILEQENYALKVLAQDTDFDMYLLESRDNISYNIKEKGAFYALNEVEGVQEYLDACFPYIKEVATNEEGDIWMIPVENTIPSLLYYREYNEEKKVDLEKMDFLEFLSFVEEIETKESEKGSISTDILVEHMFLQYLSVYDSFDTDEFRKYAKQLKQMDENAGRFGGEIPYVNSVRRVNYKEDEPAYTQEELQKIPYFYYQIEFYLNAFFRERDKLGSSDIIGMTNIPRISEEFGNVGVLTFLCVNPQSENLDFTLEYISNFCKYMLEQKDTFLLQDESTYTDTPITRECYEVYKEGNIAFAMDNEIYWNVFWDYLDGKIGLEEMIQEIERKYKIFVGE